MEIKNLIVIGFIVDLELPAPHVDESGQSEYDNITADAGDTTEAIREQLQVELGGRNRANRPVVTQQPASPVANGSLRSREKAARPVARTRTSRKRTRETDTTMTVSSDESEEEGRKKKKPVKLNSEEFPKESRPEMFRNDDRFNRLTFSKASESCWDYVKMENEKQEKDKSKSAHEKADDN